MNQNDYVEHIENLFKEAVAIVHQKNSDYATEQDPFRNFRNSTISGVPIEKGIMVRILDKITRIAHLLDKEPSVVSESIHDSIMDCCNYLAILHTYLKEQEKKNTS